ncbi:MAG: hypothetical protein ACXWP5_04990 [Bdellovibrionota bacterium]
MIILPFLFLVSQALADGGQPHPGTVPTATRAYDYSILTAEEMDILRKGPVSTTQEVFGAWLGTSLGFGIGHAIQGEYKEAGWIFTVGDTIGLGLIISSIFVPSTLSCDPTGTVCSLGGAGPILLYAGIGLYGAFHLWEIIDVFVRPRIQNVRVDMLRGRLRDRARPVAESGVLRFAPLVSWKPGIAVPGYGIGLQLSL